MSHLACNYVRQLKEAPNGELVTLTEKAVLWYLADCHNQEEKAAWPKIATIAEFNNTSERRVREILAECIRKQIVWREDRFRAYGANDSNHWRFTAIDGEAPTDARVAEERRRLRGEAAAKRANAVKVRQISTETSEPGCEISQGAGAISRTQGMRHLAGGGCDISHPQGCDISQGEDAISRTLYKEQPLTEPLVEPVVEPELNPYQQPARDGGCGNPVSEQRQENRLATIWERLLHVLRITGELSEEDHALLRDKTWQAGVQRTEGGVRLEISTEGKRVLVPLAALHGAALDRAGQLLGDGIQHVGIVATTAQRLPKVAS